MAPKTMPDGTPVTPLPMKKIMALVICSMTWGFQMNIIFPFMPFMVEWMRPDDLENTSFYVGILASSYFWGQLVASFIWPPLSDKIGRKKSLIWGQLALTIPFMCFGFTRSYWPAVAWRFINGVLQSNSPITKAYIADICDRTNSAAGMSVLAFSWGLSNVIAPTIGGLFAEPCKAYPGLCPADSLMHEWFSHERGAPYAAPPVFVFIFGFVFAIPMVMLWLPETSPVTYCDVLHGRCSRQAAKGYAELQAEEEGEALTKDDSAEGGKEGVEEQEEQHIPSYWEMMTAKDSGTALVTLMILCPTWITYQELFPLFCKATYEEGGIGFSAYQIGAAMTINGIVMVIYQPLVFPRLQRRFGNVRCYRGGTISMNILLLVFPFYHFLWDKGWVLWAAIGVQRLWEVATATAMWMPSFIMIMNTALPAYQGRMQGLAGAMQMGLMAVSPTVGGAIWNATIGKPWPISPHVVYGCLNLLAFVMLLVACQLPESLNYPKAELLKKEAAARQANGRSLGMTPLARQPKTAKEGQAGEEEKEGLLR